MTRDDILRWAREADLCPWVVKVPEAEAQKLERFAQLVAAAEREACAKVCESFTTQNDYDRNDACELISDAIRARGKP